MGTAQTVVDAQDPDFDVGEDAVDTVQDDMDGDLADNMRIVAAFVRCVFLAPTGPLHHD